MKISYLDFPKTISDFLFFNCDSPEEKAKKVFLFKHFFTPLLIWKIYKILLEKALWVWNKKNMKYLFLW